MTTQADFTWCPTHLLNPIFLLHSLAFARATAACCVACGSSAAFVATRLWKQRRSPARMSHMLAVGGGAFVLGFTATMATMGALLNEEMVRHR